MEVSKRLVAINDTAFLSLRPLTFQELFAEAFDELTGEGE